MENTLLQEEQTELRLGQELYEMTQTPGFQILKTWFEDMAFHSWVDPREIDGDNGKSEWEWRELNAFHAANNAKEILERIQQMISRAEYLDQKKKGEVKVRPMKV